MVGQENNLEFIRLSIANDCFPRFVIITGEKGSGKKTLASFIAKKCLKSFEIIPGNSVDAVRQAIDNSYRCAGVTAYIFPDADKMSIQAKNALLKITEEPPRDAFFIMTVESVNNTLETLKSRGVEIQMEAYSKKQLASLVENATDKDKIAIRIASNPGQLKQLQSIDVEIFIAFCHKVLDNIGSVTGVNAFKIGDSFNFKDDPNKYDPILFFECIKDICARNSKEDMSNLERYVETLRITSKYKREFSITGVKKDATFDMWILEMRNIWRS